MMHEHVAQQCLHANCLHMIQKKNNGHNRPNLNPRRYHIWGAMHDAFLKASSEAITVAELKVALEKTWENFPQNEAEPSLERGLESARRLVGDILSITVIQKLFMDARSAMRPCYILPMFFSSFFMAALVGQTAERIFTKLSHVVDIRCYLRTY